MVSNRYIFVLATLLLAMAITISSAPVDDDKEEFPGTTEKSFDQTEKTTGIPTEDKKKLLFKDVQGPSVPLFNEDSSRLLFDTDNSSPTAETAKRVSVLDTKDE
ncbi:unnamed protein product [Adineta ricciae]|uniref:Uncharacterized protein n=1 Tax=Adineta ricciae TaxID=249248 RepID=A0A813VQS7_ADIRI|nr:unnamed protein product [Adineta ricciae]CAF1667053.1 unnamed protein product [Adineta ricciae]